MNRLQKMLLGTGIVLGLLLISLLIFRAAFVTFVDSYELGYSYDKFTGEIKPLNRTGYFIINPWKTTIHTIDTRPMQVRIEANNRVLNAKLVRFKPQGLIQFIELHGRGDYEQAGNNGGTGNLPDILKCYAYENYGSNGYSEVALESKYTFLDVMDFTSGTNTTYQKTQTDSLENSKSRQQSQK